MELQIVRILLRKLQERADHEPSDSMLNQIRDTAFLRNIVEQVSLQDVEAHLEPALREIDDAAARGQGLGAALDAGLAPMCWQGLATFMHAAGPLVPDDLPLFCDPPGPEEQHLVDAVRSHSREPDVLLLRALLWLGAFLKLGFEYTEDSTAEASSLGEIDAFLAARFAYPTPAAERVFDSWEARVDTYLALPGLRGLVAPDETMLREILRGLKTAEEYAATESA